MIFIKTIIAIILNTTILAMEEVLIEAPNKVFITNYIAWDSKYRRSINYPVSVIIGEHVYPANYSEYERIRNGPKNMFVFVTDGREKPEYYNFEILKIDYSYLDQTQVYKDYQEKFYINYHPEYDIFIFYADNSQIQQQSIQQQSIQPVESNQEACDCDECRQEQEEESCECDECYGEVEPIKKIEEEKDDEIDNNDSEQSLIE